MAVLDHPLRFALGLALATWSVGHAMAGSDAPPAAVSAQCQYDRQQQMGLDLNGFDQNDSSGWRPIAKIPGCEAVAADLIRDYRNSHPPSADDPTGNFLLYFHEGQIRAEIGQNRAAIGLFAKAKRPPEIAYGFNQFADAHIAFLKGDLSALKAVRAALVALPKPPEYDTMWGDSGPDVPWPMNLEGVDRLIRCFGKPYRVAFYSKECARR